MFKVLKFAKDKWYIVVFIILLLFVQVFCELTLPDYTSDIVDVGIQSKGVEYPIPEKVTADTFDKLELFMTNEEKQLVEKYYVEKAEVFKADFNNLSDEKMSELKTAMLAPESLVLTLSSGGDGSAALIGMLTQVSGSASGDLSVEECFSVLKSMPDAQRDEMCAALKKQMEAYPEYMLEAAGVSFVQTEYEKLDIDMHHYQMNYLKKMAVKMLTLAVLALLISIVVGFLSSRLAAYTAKDVRRKVFSKVMSFSNAEINEFATSSLITRCTNDVQQVQMVLTVFFRIVVFAPIMGGGAILKVLHNAASMGWTVVVAVAAVIFVIAILMIVAMPKFKMMQKLIDGLNLVSREILTGLPVIRAFGREEHEEKRFDKASKDLMSTQLFTSGSMALMLPTMMFIMNGVSVLIVWVGAGKIDAGSLQVGEMMAFIVYAIHIVMSFLFISVVAIILPRAAVAADRIDEVLTSKTLILDKDDAVDIPSGKGEIKFSHVSFAYPGADEDALSDIDFTAEGGKTTAIIGSTGCGKSTLINLIPRLYDVREGSITIDGVDIRDVRMKELRKEIGFVPQKGTLFSGTIASNIRFGNENASDAEVEDAANIAQATEFIEEKENKYDFSVAQGGNNVSGGQKQRLAIARAIAKKPKVYIFDDSFSALDYKTDAALRRALKEKVKDATVIIVAQRISTIMHADKILVLEDGKIVDSGTHDELMKNSEIYQQIAESQIAKS
ncbi:MAG: ABC transporter ATP-binding protein/permease [Lachnospiraceae bacterium]|nr:ABC transporter ATP-binding protein/permease [Lachnospiraceae bacterium]